MRIGDIMNTMEGIRIILPPELLKHQPLHGRYMFIGDGMNIGDGMHIMVGTEYGFLRIPYL